MEPSSFRLGSCMGLDDSKCWNDPSPYSMTDQSGVEPWLDPAFTFVLYSRQRSLPWAVIRLTEDRVLLFGLEHGGHHSHRYDHLQ